MLACSVEYAQRHPQDSLLYQGSAVSPYRGTHGAIELWAGDRYEDHLSWRPLMRKLIVAIFALALASVIALAQRTPRQDEVEIEMMTYPEIHSAIHDHGKTTVLIYNGRADH